MLNIFKNKICLIILLISGTLIVALIIGYLNMPPGYSFPKKPYKPGDEIEFKLIEVKLPQNEKFTYYIPIRPEFYKVMEIGPDPAVYKSVAGQKINKSLEPFNVKKAIEIGIIRRYQDKLDSGSADTKSPVIAEIGIYALPVVNKNTKPVIDPNLIDQHFKDLHEYFIVNWGYEILRHENYPKGSMGYYMLAHANMSIDRYAYNSLSYAFPRGYVFNYFNKPIGRIYIIVMARIRESEYEKVAKEIWTVMSGFHFIH